MMWIHGIDRCSRKVMKNAIRIFFLMRKYFKACYLDSWIACSCSLLR